MNREQERAKRRPEKNPVVEYNKIQNKYYPELFAKFAEVNDPRNQSYIEYPVRVMLGTMYYKCISGISSMQEMTLKFNDDAAVENLYSFMSEEKKEYLPHGVIENEFLARLNPEELEKIQKDIAYSMIRRKTFDDASTTENKDNRKEKIFFTRNRLAERWMLLTTRLPSITTDGIHAKLDSSNTTCEACTAASLPDAMATLQSASFNASTSLTPSPVIATVLPWSLRACTNLRF